MTERDVDQSNLPGVEEVCQSFAVLEDGVLAHNLQEQEIEQHYSLNVQKNHLVQNDLRIARRLQDEEQTRLSNASHQREVQDSEFARRIQEDIERRAEEEARKREQEDEEIARRIQEEEVLRVGHRSGIRASIHGDDYRVPAWPRPPHHDLSWPSERQAQSRQRPVCRRHLPPPSPSPVNCEKYFLEDCKPTSSRPVAFSGSWADALRLIHNDLCEQGYLNSSSEEELFQSIHPSPPPPRTQAQIGRRHLSEGSSFRKPTDPDYHCERRGWPKDRGVRRSVSSSDGRPLDRVRSWSNTESRDRHVHFQDFKKWCNSFHGDGGRTCEGSYDWFRERDHTASDHQPETMRSGLRNEDHHNQEILLQKKVPSRLSYRQDIRPIRRVSFQSHHNSVESSGQHENRRETDTPRLCERTGQVRRSFRAPEDQRSARDQGLQEVSDTRYPKRSSRVISSSRERRQDGGESSSEEDVVRGRVDERRKPPRRSLSCRGHSSRAGDIHSAGRTGDLRVGAVSLDLGELRQVLQDEELARRLQEEEESLIRRNLRSSVLERPYPDGDFQVAQVAQDEEIARFIQKQDMKSERVWHDGETSEPRSGRGNAEMNDKCNQNPACGRQRERLNSEGLLSPSDSHSPELQARQNSRPVSMTSSPQSSRNIAEELDPTFQAKRSDTARLEQQSSGLSQSPPHSRFSSRDAARESVFVLPTKRQSEKLGQVKAKDKDGGKQNCKQQ
ncbi:coiled-coil domain-containing protein 187 isoform X2 [Denticeps clupeoides]|uniref:Coiled-coil domain-containing protein n=1 Tax=Denticeps clupeoides TaxID=299321 RepID=A0AAY4EBY6_9TELE|nr:uncharacterized protein LOC114798278 isoform X2 [Denticeps clupeoides]